MENTAASIFLLRLMLLSFTIFLTRMEQFF